MGFNFIKSNDHANSTIPKWDEETGNNLVSLADIKFRVDYRRYLYTTIGRLKREMWNSRPFELLQKESLTILCGELFARKPVYFFVTD